MCSRPIHKFCVPMIAFLAMVCFSTAATASIVVNHFLDVTRVVVTSYVEVESEFLDFTSPNKMDREVVSVLQEELNKLGKNSVEVAPLGVASPNDDQSILLWVSASLHTSHQPPPDDHPILALAINFFHVTKPFAEQPPPGRPVAMIVPQDKAEFQRRLRLLLSDQLRGVASAINENPYHDK